MFARRNSHRLFHTRYMEGPIEGPWILSEPPQAHGSFRIHRTVERNWPRKKGLPPLSCMLWKPRDLRNVHVFDSSQGREEILSSSTEGKINETCSQEGKINDSLWIALCPYERDPTCLSQWFAYLVPDQSKEPYGRTRPREFSVEFRGPSHCSSSSEKWVRRDIGGMRRS